LDPSGILASWEFRISHNDEIQGLFVGRVTKLMRQRWKGHVIRIRKTSKAKRILERHSLGKLLLARKQRRCEDIIRIHLADTGCEDV
jgi:hypothetical protein